MAAKKFVLIGAGSMAFSQALITAIGGSKSFRGSTIALVDINEESLDTMQKLTSRLTKEMDWDLNVEYSTDRTEVLSGADVISVTIAVGGDEAYQRDILIPSKYGYVQGVGDTTGIAGVARALRHVPVMVEIADDVSKFCPGARFYNFTNPLTILTRAINKLTPIPCTGLCIGVELTRKDFCGFIGEDPQGTTCYAAGINHLHFLLDIRKNGRDIYEIGRKKARDIFSDENKRKEYIASGGITPFNVQLFDALGYYPGPMDHHISEFFPQFTASNDTQHEEFPYDQAYYRGVMENHPKLMRQYKDMANGLSPLNTEAFSRETALEETQLTEIEAALESPAARLFHLNIPNAGYIRNLPDGVVVEVPVYVDSAGYHPVCVGDLPGQCIPTIARNALIHDLIIEASMEGSFDKALAAFVNDPNCNDIPTAKKCLKELIDANIAYLPRFA